MDTRMLLQCLAEAVLLVIESRLQRRVDLNEVAPESLEFDVVASRDTYKVAREPGIRGFRLTVSRTGSEKPRAVLYFSPTERKWYVRTEFGFSWIGVVHGCRQIDQLLFRYVSDLTSYETDTHEQLSLFGE